jgi:hypothetical protein
MAAQSTALRAFARARAKAYSKAKQFILLCAVVFFLLTKIFLPERGGGAGSEGENRRIFVAQVGV